MHTISIILPKEICNSGIEDLYCDLIKAFNYKGRKLDQEHIPTIMINIPHENSYELKLKCLLSLSIGAKYLILHESDRINSSSFIADLCTKYGAKYKYIAKENCKSVIHDIYEKYVEFIPLKQNIYSFTEIDINEWEKQEIKKYIKKYTIIGLIGGAGPLASSQCYKLLNEKKISYIGLDDTLSPGKNDSIEYHSNEESNPEVHFFKHYENDVNILYKYANYLAIPCNTAHKYVNKFNINNKIDLIDIRNSIIDKIKTHNADNSSNSIVDEKICKIILFSTPATINSGIYSDMMNSINIEHINPDKQVIKEIYQIINRVKTSSTDLDEIKIDFLKIVDKYRLEFGNHYIILGCTELGVMFDVEECKNNRFINSINTLADYIEKTIIKSKEGKLIDHEESYNNVRESILKKNNPYISYLKNNQISHGCFR